jgi:hypothetical protein
MTRTDKKMLEKHLDLIFEFEKYVLEHPDFAKRVPRNAIVSMRIDGDESFNRWSERLADKHTKGKKTKRVFLVNIKKMRPAVSRIEELRIERAA